VIFRHSILETIYKRKEEEREREREKEREMHSFGKQKMEEEYFKVLKIALFIFYL